MNLSIVLRVYAIVILAGFAMCQRAECDDGLKVVDLRCEYLKDPLGIDVIAPRLSWRIESSKNDVMQKSYRVKVASSKELLAQGKGDLWDSGVVQSDQSLHVDYKGKELTSRMECYWKVAVMTTVGDTVSSPGKWSMGLLKREDWQAKWITCKPSAEPGMSIPAHYFRKEFSLPNRIKRATAYVCGLGHFDLHINGKKIGDHVEDPGITIYPKRAFYVTFDVTNDLQSGENAVGVILGSGRYYWHRGGQYFGMPCLFLQIEVELENGSVTRIVSDDSWLCTDQGPIRENHEFDGETYDACMEMPGWDKPGFKGDHWWAPIFSTARNGELQAQMMEPMRVVERLKPISVTPSKRPGCWIVDFGQNFYGNVELRVKGKRGDKVAMVSAYRLDNDGNLLTTPNRTAKCTDTYILKGGGTEEWHPQFVGRGFRRIEVSGFPGEPKPENFEGLVIHTDMEPRGEFECSNPIINRIHQNYRWTARSFSRSFPMDPDRDERQGWTGDTAKAPESQLWDFGVASFYSKWIDDHRYDQLPNGMIPLLIPSLGREMQPDVLWPATLVLIPETLYRYYGDKQLLHKNYDTIKRFVDFSHKQKNAEGVIPSAPYADWCDVSAMKPVRKRGRQNGRSGRYECGATDGGLLSTAYQYNHEMILSRFADLIGNKEDASLYRQQAEVTKRAFNAVYLDPATGIYRGSTQTGQLVPLTFGLVPAENRSRVIEALVDDILITRNGHLSVGLIGMGWLMQTLSDIGRSDTAYVLAAQTTKPSWGYMAEKGATSIWERWDTDTGDMAMNSEMLLLLSGNFNAWLYQTLAGINPDDSAPGFKKIIIKPCPLGDLTWVKAYHDSLYGRIESNWKREGDRFVLDVVVPPNTSATVILPDGTSHSVESGKYNFTCAWKPFSPAAPEPKQMAKRDLVASEGYITFWNVSGPYYALEKGQNHFDAVYPPEKPGQQVAWLGYDSQKTGDPKILQLGKLFDGFEHATYLETTITASEDRSMELEIGTPDRLKVWVNGQLINPKATEAKRWLYDVDLKKGDNSVLIKTLQMKPEVLDISTRLSAKDGKDLRGLVFKSREK
jgi:alpha-L-rhamnosidase